MTAYFIANVREVTPGPEESPLPATGSIRDKRP